MKMTGKITGISGPTVRTDLKGLKLFERVFVGDAMLIGEVVKIEKNHSLIQIYEETRGIALGEPVKGTGVQLTVRLGPGMLSGIFDGLQRSLKKLRDVSGPFICHTKQPQVLGPEGQWRFYPLKKTADRISCGDILGYVEEGLFRHDISCPFEGILSWIADGSVNLSDAVGTLQDGSAIYGFIDWPVRIPRPYRKKYPPRKLLVTGQRSIDFLFPLAIGGTAIMPGGFGTGKTILEQSIAKCAEVDIVVYVGCGERGNEMAEMIEEFEQLKDPWTGKRLMERTILCVNTSNMPVAAREASIFTAVTIAEYYRDMGLHVLLLADSISRWAEALREISSSLEEMPGEEGYPTYLASRMSGFMERAGVVETVNGSSGSLSMVLAVSPPGGDLTEPVTQSCLRAGGTLLQLDTSLAHRRHFPAINWFQSYTLYEKELREFCIENVSPGWEESQSECREILRKEKDLREIEEIIGVEGLQAADRLAMYTAEKIRSEFLCQNAYTDDAFSPPEKTLLKIDRILDFHKTAEKKLKEGVALEEILIQNKQL